MIKVECADHCVCFIDLLGQSDELKRYPVIPDKVDQKYDEWLSMTYGKVRLLQKYAKSYLGRFSDYFAKTYSTRGYSSKLKIGTMSDSIIIYASISDNLQRNCYIDIITILTTIGRLFIDCFLKNIIFRAAVVIGIGLELPSSGLYGSVIANAYRTESQIAQYPRIVVEAKSYSYIERIECNAKAKLLTKIVKKDFDQQYIVNYVGDFFSALDKNHERKILNMRRKASDLRRQFSKVVDKRDEKLFIKYHRLLKFLSREYRHNID